MRLPPELRIRVYEMLWASSTTTITGADHGTPIPLNFCNPQRAFNGVESQSYCNYSVPNGLALITDPQIQEEAGTSWLTHTRFYGPARLLTRFLDHLHPEYVDRVRKVEIDFRFSLFHFKMSLELGAALLYYQGSSKLDLLTVNVMCWADFLSAERSTLLRELKAFPGQTKVRLYRQNIALGSKVNLSEVWIRDKGNPEFEIHAVPRQPNLNAW